MASKDLKLGTHTNGLYTHDLVINEDTLDLEFVSGIDYIVQALKIRLLLFSEEWYLDTSKGLPWFTDILIKNPRMEVVDALIKQKIVSTPGVVGLLSYSSTYTNATRSLAITFTVEADEGQLAEVSLTVP